MGDAGDSSLSSLSLSLSLSTTGLLKGLVGVTPVTVESFTAWRDKLEKAQEVCLSVCVFVCVLKG